MKITRCPNGHYYDQERYGNECPHCKASTSGVAQASTDEKTMPLNTSTAGVTVPVDSISKNVSPLEEDDPTIGMANGNIGSTKEPVVGWLVCVKGVNMGADYRLRAGRNFVGRSDKMDVCLAGDTSVSRTSHAVIVYDPKSNVYLAQPGESKELFYVGGEAVLETRQLKGYDMLEIGKSVLLFIPLCSEKFVWTKIQNT